MRKQWTAFCWVARLLGRYGIWQLNGLIAGGLSRGPSKNLFLAWKPPIGLPGGNEHRRLTFLAVIWTIWKERNSRCFEAVVTSENCLVEITMLTVAFWVAINPSFKGYSYDQIVLPWKEMAISFAGPKM